MVQELRDFITRGNLVTLGVGFVMGVAFAAIVASFVNDIVMPVVGIPFGQPDFTSLTWTVNGSKIMWGSFVTAVAVFFLVVKPYNAFEARRASSDAEGPAAPSETDLLIEIRDLLAR